MQALERRHTARAALIALALGACSDARHLYGSAEQAETPESGWKIVNAFDFNDDGLTDALWNDPTTNRVAVWLTRGTGLLEPGPVIPGPPGRGWAAVTAQDFNRDGMADVPFFNPDVGRAAVWLFRGTHLVEMGPEIPTPPGDGWVLAYAGDMDGDGMADLLWYNPTTFRIAVWLMAGTCVRVAGPVLPGPVGDGWTVATIADFNFDGTGDALWFNAKTQRMSVWLIRGTQVLERGPEIPGPPGDGWAVVTGADFNGDGYNDALWNNATTNRMAVWLMRGTRLFEPGPEIPGPAGDGWSLGTAGDVNGDGMADAYWQNPTNHTMALWLMRGTRLLLPGPSSPDRPEPRAPVLIAEVERRIMPPGGRRPAPSRD